MLPPRHLAPIISAAIGTLFVPVSAFAQAPQTRQVALGQPVTLPARNQIRDRSLKPLLEKVVWDPAQRGPLLIVAPESTLPARDRRRPFQLGVVTVSSPTTPPEPGPGDSYRLPDLGQYFGRQARTVGKRLTVFAPTTMTTLTTRLPKPDPYAGMGPNDKLRLFQSTLTTAQWHTIGSQAGIAIGDLDRKQRDLFLSLLPDPFVVWPAKRGKDGERLNYYDPRASGVTLTPAQRQNVRLSLRRLMDWYFTSMNGNGSPGRTHIGVPSDDGAEYELHGSGFGSNFGSEIDLSAVFGVSLLEEVPARRKPGQLPFAWTALDTPVSLDGAATVGELVRRVAERTRVEVFCDSRYADLSVYTRSAGSPVRAGDLLEALSLAVTGTFRKVGGSDGGPAAFVMTDDLEGLGTRHARIQAWATTNAALSQQRRNEVEAALEKAPIGDSVGWADSDPMRPSDDLSQKIEDHRKKISDPKLPAPNTPARRAEQSLIVPVSELPAPAQEMVRRQLEDHEKSLESRKNDPYFASHPEAFAFAPLQTDRVVMDVQVRASFIVPGMGTITSQGNGSSSDAAQSLTTVSPLLRRPADLNAAAPAPVTIPSDYEVRALLVAPYSSDEATRAVAAAKAHGLNQVWIALPPVPPSGKDSADSSAGPLVAAIAAGKKSGVSVGAVVRLLRGGPTSAAGTDAPSPFPADRNLVGETTTDFATRRAAMPSATLPYMRPVLTPAQESARLLRLGDWLLPDEPGVRAAALKRATAVAATPGLAGIVLCDVAAPGYDGASAAYSPFGFLDGGEQMGYTEPMRLAFLRESGVDPIDLSPLPQGKISLPFSMSSYGFVDMQIPLFPDYGPDAANSRINERSATDLGAKNATERWQQFRAAKSDAMTQSIVQAIRTLQPDLFVRVQRGGDLFNGGPMSPFFDTWTEALSPAKTPPARSGIQDGQPAHSSDALLTVRCAPLSKGALAPGAVDLSADEFTNRLGGLMARVVPGWKGVVIDLSEVTVDRALPLFSRLQSSPTPPPGAGPARVSTRP